MNTEAARPGDGLFSPKVPGSSITDTCARSSVLYRHGVKQLRPETHAGRNSGQCPQRSSRHVRGTQRPTPHQDLGESIFVMDSHIFPPLGFPVHPSFHPPSGPPLNFGVNRESNPRLQLDIHDTNHFTKRPWPFFSSFLHYPYSLTPTL